MWSILLLVMMLWISGCGDEVNTAPSPDEEPIGGLSDDTYVSYKFGITVSNLPVDEWTVKELGNKGQGIRQESKEGYVPLHHLLLMEPVPIGEFVGLDEKASLVSVIMEKIPFIWVATEVYTKSTENLDLSESLDLYIEAISADVESRELVEIGGITAIQAVLIRRSGLRESLIWFAKRRLIVRCEYLSNETDFYKYYNTYTKVAYSISLELEW